MILLPAKGVGRKLNHTDSLSKKPFFAEGILGSKKLQTVLAKAKYDKQSRQEVKNWQTS